MSIADKVTTIFNNVPIVFGEGRKLGFDEGMKDGSEIGYERGFADGKTEGHTEGYNEGYQAYYDFFWDGMQNKGTSAVNYNSRFYQFYTTGVYNPKHDFIHGAAASPQNMFRESHIKDVLKDSHFKDTHTLAYTFYYATYLTNARTLYVTEGTKYTSPFSGCDKLTEVYFEGVIGQNGLNFSVCPLILECAISAIMHLKDFTTLDPDNVFTCTIKFSPKTWEYLNADGENSPNGTTWAEYIDSLGWNC